MKVVLKVDNFYKGWSSLVYMADKRFSISYYVQEIKNGDYFLRRVGGGENLKSLEGAKSIVVSVPLCFLEGLSPREVGMRLVGEYERRRRGNYVLDESLVKISRHIDETGVSLSILNQSG